MTDDLTAQVAAIMFRRLDDAKAIQDTPHPRICAKLLAADLAPQIAACMRAVHSKTLYDVENGEPIEPTDTEADAYAAGLAALRGET